MTDVWEHLTTTFLMDAPLNAKLNPDSLALRMALALRFAVKAPLITTSMSVMMATTWTGMAARPHALLREGTYARMALLILMTDALKYVGTVSTLAWSGAMMGTL
jgi:hypothetical protein